jgi:hypothetical protein
MLYEKDNVHRGEGNYIFVKPIGILYQVIKALSIGTLKNQHGFLQWIKATNEGHSQN